MESQRLGQERGWGDFLSVYNYSKCMKYIIFMFIHNEKNYPHMQFNLG